MAQPSAVIDLDVARREPDELTRYAAGRSRWPLPVLVCLLLLVALGGAAPPGYRLIRLFSVPVGVAGLYVLSGDALYVPTRTGVSAYRVPSGTRSWVAASNGREAGLVVPVPAAGVVLIAASADRSSPGVIALDAGTGRERWRDGQAQLVTFPLPRTTRVLLMRPDEVVCVDAATGRTVWHRSHLFDLAVPAGQDAGDGPDRVVFDSPDGSTDVVDAGTGALVARRRLPARPTETGTAADVDVNGYPRWIQTILGDLLVVSTRQQNAIVLDAYDLATLAHRWRTRVPSGEFFIEDCAPAICVLGGAGMVGVDRRTGAVLWRSGWQIATRLSGGLLLVSNSPTQGPAAIVDARTLRPVLPLNYGYPVIGGAWRDRALVQWMSDSVTTTFAMVEAHGSAWGTPQRRVIARVPGAQPDSCSATSRYLVCPVMSDRLVFWRYR